MRTIEISDLVVLEDRQRKNKDEKRLQDLKKGILEVGLLQAPVIFFNTENKPQLIAGERRVIAMRELHQDGLEFRHDGELVPLNQMPFTLVHELDEVQLQEAELFENILRAPLDWKDELDAKMRIHNLRVKDNPEQTIKATAEEISVSTQRTPDAERVELQRMQTVAQHLGAPMVQSAKNLRTAYARVLDHKKKHLERELIALNPEASPHTLIVGDCLKELEKIPKGSFDLILVDPPYGIEAHYMKEANEHNYDDSPKNALEICDAILRVGFHLLKPQGHVFMFCDIDHFVRLRNYAQAQAFTPWRTPIIWSKGLEGRTPWGNNGFTRVSEYLLWAVKGQKPLVLPGGPDVLQFKRVARTERVHAAEKPAELLRRIVQTTCRNGDRILDPCCGSGPIFSAVAGLGIQVTGIELNPENAALASSRMLDSGDSDVPDGEISHEKTVHDITREILEGLN